jgi:uncharacterized protein (DUF433 family)
MITEPHSYAGRIVINPSVLAGKPIVAGTRIPVSLILNLMAHGYDVDKILRAYPSLTEDDVRAAVAYAEARLNREEVRLISESV